jgi:putative chitinase
MHLKLGSKGDDVKKLQETLGLDVDGTFGTITEKTVKEWQSKNGLVSDGVVGDSTWSKLFVTNVEVDANGILAFINKLKGHIPDAVFSQLPATCAAYNIITPLRLAHFMAQCAHESGNFKWTTELATGKAYEGRKDLGNIQPGDGVKFKGRGYIQLTGRANYEKFSKFCGEDCVTNPELVATKYPMLSAAYFFQKTKLWDICDQGSDETVVTKVSKRVNGGTNGLEDRKKKFKNFWSILSK